MLAATSTLRYNVGRATTIAGSPFKRPAARIASPVAILPVSGGLMRRAISSSLDGTLASS